jgi:hypothetical protein
MKNSFKFYNSWGTSIDLMEEQELRRFIKNLIRHSQDEPIELITKVDLIVWSQVEPLLNYNEKERQKKISNGKNGGAPKGNNNASKNDIIKEITKNNQKQPKTNVEDVDVDVVVDVVVDVDVEEDVDVVVDEKKPNLGKSMYQIINKL